MIRITLFVILLFFAPSAKTESEDIVSSGEGEASVTSITQVPRFIDDDGELISRAFTPPSMDSTANVTETSFDDFISENSTTTKEVTTEKALTTTLPPMTTTSTADTTTTTTTTPYPTTTEKTTSTTMETTTTTTATPETTTTTTKPTTTMRTTKKAVTTTRRTTRRTTRIPTTKSTTTTVSPALLETTPFIRGELCVFLDPDLSCKIDVTCYGEGELDCTGNFDGPPSEPSVSNKIVSPTFEEVSEEYEDVGSDTIPTFPPDLVGKRIFPSLYKFGSLGTTEMTSTMMPYTEGKTTESKDVTQQEITVGAESTTERPTQPSTTSTTISTKATTTMQTSVTEMDTTTPETEALTEATVSQITSTTSTAVPSTTENDLAVQNFTILPKDSSTVTSDESDELSDVETSVVQRRKREEQEVFENAESYSSSMSKSLQAAALEYKNRVKSCRIIGNMICDPLPTRDVCKGRSSCQVITGTSKTLEKAAGVKSLESWTVAVIVMGIIAVILSIVLAVYFVVTSWKKLKVQPQNGVTTLTYVNNTPP